MIFTMILWLNGSRIINRVPPFYYVRNNINLGTQEIDVFLKEENKLYVIPINFLFLQFK